MEELVGKKFIRHGRIYTVVALDGPEGYKARVRMVDGTEYCFPEANVAYYVATNPVPVPPKPIIKVYGCLWLKDGRQIDMEGMELDEVIKAIGDSEIVHYGEHTIGDDANVYIDAGGITGTLVGLKVVQDFFKGVK